MLKGMMGSLANDVCREMQGQPGYNNIRIFGISRDFLHDFLKFIFVD